MKVERRERAIDFQRFSQSNYLGAAGGAGAIKVEIGELWIITKRASNKVRNFWV
jgi:hypothetical protein